MSYDPKNIPSIILRLLEKPPILRGESPETFYEYFESVVSGTEPNDVIEWAWALQFTCGSWDALRLRRLRAVYLDSRHDASLHEIIRGLKWPTGRSSQSRGAYDKICLEVDAILAQCKADPSHLRQHHIDPDLVPATALVRNAEKLEMLDRMIERAERRCDAIVQQLAVRRAVFAVKAREVAERVAHERAAIGQTPLLIEATVAASPANEVVEPSSAENETKEETSVPKDQPSPPVVPDLGAADQGVDHPPNEGDPAESSAPGEPVGRRRQRLKQV